MTTTVIASPLAWIATHRAQPPVIYVAHPVAPAPGDCIAECLKCRARRLYAASGSLDLRSLCEHDAPVSHSSKRDEIVAYNLERALRWWRWLETLEAAVFTMPWYTNVTANGEGDPAKIKRGLRDDVEIVKRCDALILCGPRISSGMRIEADTAHAAGKSVFRVGHIVPGNGEPPDWPADQTPWARWEP
jgi:hypothetical protein